MWYSNRENAWVPSVVEEVRSGGFYYRIKDYGYVMPTRIAPRTGEDPPPTKQPESSLIPYITEFLVKNVDSPVVLRYKKGITNNQHPGLYEINGILRQYRTRAKIDGVDNPYLNYPGEREIAIVTVLNVNDDGTADVKLFPETISQDRTFLIRYNPNNQSITDARANVYEHKTVEKYDRATRLIQTRSQAVDEYTEDVALTKMLATQRRGAKRENDGQKRLDETTLASLHGKDAVHAEPVAVLGLPEFTDNLWFIIWSGGTSFCRVITWVDDDSEPQWQTIVGDTIRRGEGPFTFQIMKKEMGIESDMTVVHMRNDFPANSDDDHLDIKSRAFVVSDTGNSAVPDDTVPVAIASASHELFVSQKLVEYTRTLFAPEFKDIEFNNKLERIQEVLENYIPTGETETPNSARIHLTFTFDEFTLLETIFILTDRYDLYDYLHETAFTDVTNYGNIVSNVSQKHASLFAALARLHARRIFEFITMRLGEKIADNGRNTPPAVFF